MIPTTYSEWKDCIVNDCGMLLTAAYINKRIAELKDASNSTTIQFKKLYGWQHTENVIQWFEQALKEYSTTF